jgi:hypothetical protein
MIASAAGQHLDAPVRKVTGPAGDLQPFGFAHCTGAEKYALNFAANKKTPAD